MYTSLYSASVALSSYLRAQLESLPAPGLGFGSGGTRVVSLNSPHEMREEMHKEGLSTWLYRVERDPMRMNVPPARIAADLLLRPPMPLHLHYLMVPVTSAGSDGGAPDIEQKIIGRVIQALHSRPILSGVDFKDTDLEGTDTELHVHLETLALDDLSRVWDALEGSFQLAVSYEVAVVNVDAALEPVRIAPVEIALPETAVIVGAA